MNIFEDNKKNRWNGDEMVELLNRIEWDEDAEIEIKKINQ